MSHQSASPLWLCRVGGHCRDRGHECHVDLSCGRRPYTHSSSKNTVQKHLQIYVTLFMVKKARASTLRPRRAAACSTANDGSLALHTHQRLHHCSRDTNLTVVALSRSHKQSKDCVRADVLLVVIRWIPEKFWSRTDKFQERENKTALMGSSVFTSFCVYSIKTANATVSRG